MDLSWLKWPSIVLVVALVFWLLSSGGVNFMYNKFTSTPPGENAEVDKRNEAGLTKLGNYLMKTLRYSRAEEVIQRAVDDYGPEADHYWLNVYRLVRLAEKREDYEHAVELLEYLIDQDAPSRESSIPQIENLEARVEKLIEVHELDKKKR
jgi:tetratricopeptide (TPR) repeat protein